RAFRLPALGEDERARVEPRDRPADNLLRVAEAVLGGGVDPVDAELEGVMDRRDRVVVVLRAPAPVVLRAAHRPGSDADARDLEAGRAELHALHEATATGPEKARRISTNRASSARPAESWSSSKLRQVSRTS